MPDEILLGIDYGETNIGLAFGRVGLVSPLNIISAKNTEEAIQEIVKVVHLNRVNKIIIGLPLTSENKETQQSQRTRNFTKLLKTFVKVPVEYVNEFATSKAAVKGAIERGVSKKRRRGVDNIAAALILKRYYENTAN